MVARSGYDTIGIAPWGCIEVNQTERRIRLDDGMRDESTTTRHLEAS